MINGYSKTNCTQTNKAWISIWKCGGGDNVTKHHGLWWGTNLVFLWAANPTKSIIRKARHYQSTRTFGSWQWSCTTDRNLTRQKWTGRAKLRRTEQCSHVTEKHGSCLVLYVTGDEVWDETRGRLLPRCNLCSTMLCLHAQLAQSYHPTTKSIQVFMTPNSLNTLHSREAKPWCTGLMYNSQKTTACERGGCNILDS